MQDFVVGTPLTREESITLLALFKFLPIEIFEDNLDAIGKIAGAMADAHDYAENDDLVFFAEEYDEDELTDFILLFQEIEEEYGGLDNMEAVEKVVMLKFLLAVSDATRDME